MKTEAHLHVSRRRQFASLENCLFCVSDKRGGRALGAAASAAQRVKTLSCNNRAVYHKGFVSWSHADWLYCLSLGLSTGPLYQWDATSYGLCTSDCPHVSPGPKLCADTAKKKAKQASWNNLKFTIFETKPGLTGWCTFCSMKQQPLVGQGHLIIESSQSHSGTPYSLKHLWISDQPVTETSTWQHIRLTTDMFPCPRRDSNPQSQQGSGHWDRPSSVFTLDKLVYISGFRSLVHPRPFPRGTVDTIL